MTGSPAELRGRARIVGWIDDRMSPVVVRELRRGFRSRSLQVLFVLLLATGVIGVVSAADNPAASLEAGISQLVVALAIALVGVIPLQAGFAVAREQRSGAGAAVAMTGLTAREIVGGRFSTGWVHAGFVLAALGPFLLVMGSIGTASTLGLAAALGVVLLAHPLSMALSVLVGSVEVRGGLEGLRNAALVQGALGITGLAGLSAVVLLESPGELFSRDGILFSTCGTWIVLTVTPALAGLAVERHLPPRIARGAGPRLWLAAHALGLSLLPVVTPRIRPSDLIVYAVWLTLLVSVWLAYTLGSTAPTRDGWRRPFGAGEREARWLSYIMLLVATAALGALQTRGDTWPFAVLLLPLQVVGVASLPVLARPFLPPAAWPASTQRIAFVGLFVVSLFLPLGGRHSAVPVPLVGLSPTVGLAMLEGGSMPKWFVGTGWAPAAALVWACLAVLAEYVLAEQSRRKESAP